MTIEGRVQVFRYSRGYGRRQGRRVKKPYHVIVCVWMPDEEAPKHSGEHSWMIQAPSPHRDWPAAAVHEGHNVRITATFRPYPIGATALRAKVECADEAEHVMAALSR